jgi:hypothetical protein
MPASLVLQLRKRADIETFVGDFAFGVGVVRKAQNKNPLNVDEIGWSSAWGHGEISADEWLFFKKHQVTLIGLLPLEAFLQAAYRPHAHADNKCTKLLHSV